MFFCFWSFLRCFGTSAVGSGFSVSNFPPNSWFAADWDWFFDCWFPYSHQSGIESNSITLASYEYITKDWPIKQRTLKERTWYLKDFPAPCFIPGSYHANGLDFLLVSIAGYAISEVVTWSIDVPSKMTTYPSDPLYLIYSSKYLLIRQLGMVFLLILRLSSGRKQLGL